MIKKYLFFVILVSNYGISQIISNGTTTANITGQNPFFDASTNFDNSIVPDSNGKGLVFPRTDLTTWQFNTELLDGLTFPSAFDGMIVYNIGTGTTLAGQGQVVSVSPGFYYFSNPGASTAITNGTWVKIGAQGPQGLKGDTGSEGPQGAQGVAGTNGSNGATWTSGSGVPSDASGSNGDYYLDTTTSDVYLKTSGIYNIVTNIKGATGTQGPQGLKGDTGSEGPQGAQGAAGTNGSNGATWTSGSGVPSDASGSNGDYYLDTTTSDVYLKAANTYSILTNIKGATGAQGPQGTQGLEGTTNMLSKFTGTSTLGNSNISDNGSLVSITTDATVNGLSIGRGPGNYDSNTVLGLKALDNITSGLYNTAVGHQALRYNSSGSNNVAVGRDALFNNTTGGANIALGKSALLNNTTGGGNIAFGFDTMLLNTIGIDNVAVGNYALRQNITGSQNTAVGRGSLTNTTANLNTAIGWSALWGNTSGIENVAIGNSAGTDSSSGSNMTSTNYSVYIGARTKGLNVTGSTNEIVIGNAAVGLGSNSTVLGNSETTKSAIYGNLLLGTTTDDGFKLNVNGTGRFSGQLSLGSTITNGTNTYTLPSATGTLVLTSGTNTTNTLPKFTGTSTLGNSNISDNGSLVSITTDASVNGLSLGRGPGNFDSNTVFGIGSLLGNTTGTNNSAYGYMSLRFNTTGSQNIAIGRDALYKNTTGNYNLAVGKGALLNNTAGFSNIAIGNDSGLKNTLGSENIAVGLFALSNNLSGYYNTVIGNGGLYASTASNNTAFGWSALNMVELGSDNIAIGFNAGRYTGSGTTPMTSVSNSIYIGSQSRGLNATGSTNEIVIGNNNTVGLGSNSIVLGNSATTKSAIYGNLLLGTTTDDGFKINVNGTGRFSGQLSLGSTITNGTNTYTLPSTTGTLALASELHSPVTIGTANGLSLSEQALTLGLASTSANGALSATDWTTFNNKVGGSGIINYIPKFTASGALGNSLIFDNGSNVGIGTTSPGFPLHVFSTSINQMLKVESNSVDGTALIIQNNSSGGTYWRLYSSGSNNGEGAGHLLFNNSTGVPMMIRNGGNVLIGTTSDIGAKLNVNGTGRFAGQLFLGSTITNGTNTFTLPSATGTFALTSDLGSYLPLSGGSLTGSLAGKSATFMGTVGVNNPSPNYPLDVFSNTLYTSDVTYARFGNGSSTAPANPYRWIELGRYGASNGATGYIQGESDNQIYRSFAINPRGGSVLIGTTSNNGSKLQVNGAYTNSTSNNEGSDTTIDFSLSNIAYTATTSNAILIDNIKDGGTYHLAITDTTMSDKVTFTVPAGFFLRDMGTTNRTSGNMHLYRFVVAGSNVFVTMSTGN